MTETGVIVAETPGTGSWRCVTTCYCELSLGCAPVRVRTVAHDGAKGGRVDHLAIEHPAVFECKVQLVSVFGLQPALELDEARLAAWTDVDAIRNPSETTRTAFHCTCSI